ncbi:MAG TPA: hypothetical protein DCM27_06060, partial [Rhodospirillaceae bacterium]|nr:hypothetical protein [Rhodospirillaceae bacterium]
MTPPETRFDSVFLNQDIIYPCQSSTYPSIVMHIMKEKKPPKIHKPRQVRLLQEEDIAIWGQATADVTTFSAPNIMTDDRAKGLKRSYKDKIGQNMTGTITLETFNGPAVQTHHSSSFQIDAALK